MSFALLTAAMDAQPHLSNLQAVVLMRYAYWQTDTPRKVQVKTLARICRRDAKRVREALRDLVELGHIPVELVPCAQEGATPPLDEKTEGASRPPKEGATPPQTGALRPPIKTKRINTADTGRRKRVAPLWSALSPFQKSLVMQSRPVPGFGKPIAPGHPWYIAWENEHLMERCS